MIHLQTSAVHAHLIQAFVNLARIHALHLQAFVNLARIHALRHLQASVDREVVKLLDREVVKLLSRLVFHRQTINYHVITPVPNAIAMWV